MFALKILYQNSAGHTLICGDIKRVFSTCYLKKLFYAKDRRTTTLKFHHHTGYEIHFIICGHQEYEIGKERIALKAGEFLAIPPGVSHRFAGGSEDAMKYSLLFTPDFPTDGAFTHGRISERTKSNIAFIEEQSALHTALSNALTGNAISELIAPFLPEMPNAEGKDGSAAEAAAPWLLAKQFILDNIGRPLRVEEVARYSHYSARHLGRIFHTFEGMSLTAFRQKARAREMERLVAETSLSFKEISEKLGFSNEYHFHTVFKKTIGLPPGVYRKSLNR